MPVFRKWNKVLILAVAFMALLLGACTPAATPTPTAVPKAPAPTAAPKAPDPTKPPAAAATVAPTATATPRPATVKFGSLPTIGDAGVFVGIERGYFKEQGITAEAVTLRTTPELIPAVSTGQIDTAGVAFSVALLAAADRGIQLKITADKGTSQRGFEQSMIVLRKDLADSGQVKTPADLKGMKISLPTLGGGTVGEQTVAVMLKQVGLTTNDVELVVLQFPDVLAALANKSIAAAFLVEPYTATGVQQGLLVKWKPVSEVFGGKFQTTSIVYSPGLVADQDLGRRWMIGYLKGVRDYVKTITTKQGWDDLISILIKYTAQKDPQQYKAMELPYLDPDGIVDKKSLDLYTEYFAENKLYEGKRTFHDLMDTSFAQYAVQKLGKSQ